MLVAWTDDVLEMLENKKHRWFEGLEDDSLKVS